MHNTINYSPASKYRHILPSFIMIILGSMLFITYQTTNNVLQTFIHWCTSFILVSLSSNLIITTIIIILSSIFIIGVIRMILFMSTEIMKTYKLRSYLRLHRNIKNEQDIKIKFHCIKNYNIWVTSTEDISAFTIGLKNPIIVIGSNLINILSKKETEVILEHEIQHVIKHDPAKKFFWESIRRLFFFVPILSDFVVNVIKNQELLADYNVVKNDPIKQDALRLSIRSMLLYKTRKPLSTACHFISSNKHLRWILGKEEARIEYYFSAKRAVYSSLLFIILLGSFGYSVMAKTSKTNSNLFCEKTEQSILESQEIMTPTGFIMINYTPIKF